MKIIDHQIGLIMYPVKNVAPGLDDLNSLQMDDYFLSRRLTDQPEAELPC